MGNINIIEAMKELDLTQKELSELMQINIKTVNRWVNRGKIPGPAREALRSWLELNKLGIAWNPAQCNIGISDNDEIKLIIKDCQLKAIKR